MNNRRQPRFAATPATPRNNRSRRVAIQEVPITSQLDAIRLKFQRLRELDTQIGQMHAIYAERDRLLGELLPVFVTVTPTQFIVNREITIGTEVHRITPSFFDTRTNTIKSKAWKSAAFESFTVE